MPRILSSRVIIFSDTGKYFEAGGAQWLVLTGSDGKSISFGLVSDGGRSEADFTVSPGRGRVTVLGEAYFPSPITKAAYKVFRTMSADDVRKIYSAAADKKNKSKIIDAREWSTEE